MRFFRYYWPFVLWAILILILTGLPGNYFPKVPTIWDLLAPDKIVHLFIFIVFTILLYYGLTLHNGDGISSWMYALIVIGAGVCYGGITEMLQAYIFVWRQASVYDFIADSVGCIVGYLLFRNVIFKQLNKY
jgi:VanZ family protein